MQRNLVLLLLIGLCGMLQAQEYAIEERTVTGIFPAEGRTRAEITTRANEWIQAQENNTSLNVASIEQLEGRIRVTGVNEALYRNLGRVLYPKRSAMAEMLTGKFGYWMEIFPEDDAYTVVYSIVDMQEEMYRHDELFYQCINFNELEPEAIAAYNKSMDKLLKGNFVFKNKRELFAENSPMQFREASDHLRSTIQVAMDDLYAYISGN